MIKTFGISVYISSYDIEYIKKFNKQTLIFLSLHIPEEMNDPQFREKVINIIQEIKSNGYEVLCDISPKGLELMGYKDIPEMVDELNIDYIRLDFGYEDKVGELHKSTNVVINASTINETKDIPQNSIFMHNFYLRRDTGLSSEYFNEINGIIKKDYNGRIFTFIPGDKELRGPIKEKLTTLEKHRNIQTFISFLEMHNDDNIDGIFIGDISLEDETISDINYFLETGIIKIKLHDCRISGLLDKPFTIRSDTGANVLRINETRWTNDMEKVNPLNNVDRPIGTVTMDNFKYKRYMGEVQITKVDLPKDDRVNVVGHIPQEYVDVIKPLHLIMFK